MTAMSTCAQTLRSQHKNMVSKVAATFRVHNVKVREMEDGRSKIEAQLAMFKSRGAKKSSTAAVSLERAAAAVFVTSIHLSPSASIAASPSSCTGATRRATHAI